MKILRLWQLTLCSAILAVSALVASCEVNVNKSGKNGKPTEEEQQRNGNGDRTRRPLPPNGNQTTSNSYYQR